MHGLLAGLCLMKCWMRIRVHFACTADPPHIRPGSRTDLAPPCHRSVAATGGLRRRAGVAPRQGRCSNIIAAQRGPMRYCSGASRQTSWLLLRGEASLWATCFMAVCEHPLCCWWPSRLRSRHNVAARSGSAQPPARWASPNQRDERPEDWASSSAIGNAPSRRRFAAEALGYAPRL